MNGFANKAPTEGEKAREQMSPRPEEAGEVEEGVGASGRHRLVATCDSGYAWSSMVCKDGGAAIARIQTSKFPNGALITVADGGSHLLVPRQSSQSQSLKWHLLPSGQEDAGVDKHSGAPEHIATLRLPQKEHRPASLLLAGVRYLLVRRRDMDTPGSYSVFRMAHAMPSPNGDPEVDLKGVCIGGVVCAKADKGVPVVILTFCCDVPHLLSPLLVYLAKYHADRASDGAALLTRFPRAVITSAVSAFSA